MAYKNILKDFITIGKPKTYKCCIINLFYKRRIYELSFLSDDGSSQDPNDLSIEKIISYISYHYIEENIFEYKGHIINDLVVFKTYRDELNLMVENHVFFVNILAILVAFLTIAYTVENVINEKQIICLNFLIFLLIIITCFFYWHYRERKKSDFNKLKTINNVIYILEALKDEMVKENKIHGTTYEVNVDNLVGEKSESRKYLVDVNEILEDEINEGKNKDTDRR